jgi:hypothetical protein
MGLPTSKHPIGLSAPDALEGLEVLIDKQQRYRLTHAKGVHTTATVKP